MVAASPAVSSPNVLHEGKQGAECCGGDGISGSGGKSSWQNRVVAGSDEIPSGGWLTVVPRSMKKSKEEEEEEEEEALTGCHDGNSISSSGGGSNCCEVLALMLGGRTDWETGEDMTVDGS